VDRQRFFDLSSNRAISFNSLMTALRSGKPDGSGDADTDGRDSTCGADGGAGGAAAAFAGA
jgi:hypothetical protein